MFFNFSGVFRNAANVLHIVLLTWKPAVEMTIHKVLSKFCLDQGGIGKPIEVQNVHMIWCFKIECW